MLYTDRLRYDMTMMAVIYELCPSIKGRGKLLNRSCLILHIETRTDSEYKKGGPLIEGSSFLPISESKFSCVSGHLVSRWAWDQLQQPRSHVRDDELLQALPG